MSMRFQRSLSGLMVLVLVISSSSYSLLEPPSSTAQPDEPELILFVQTASSGSLTSVNTTAGLYRLTLQNVFPKVLFFSDRPYRDSGSMAVSDYLSDVFMSTEANPNAALVIEQPDNNQITIALELSEPNYNASSSTLTYLVRQIGEVTEALAHFSFDSLETLPTQFGSAELFIDASFDNRCYGFFTNNLSVTASLDEEAMDPPYSDSNWGDHPFHTVSPNGGKTGWTFRFHNDTGNVTGSVVYVIQDGSQSYSATMGFRCERSALQEEGGAGQAWCDYDTHLAPFICSADTTNRHAVFSLNER